MQQKHPDQSQKQQNTAKGPPNQHSIGEQIKAGTEANVKEARQEVAAARRPWYQSVRWGYILLTGYTILLALFALLAWWVSIHPVLAIDVAITREFQENQSPWLRNIMVAVSYIGNVLPLSIGLIALAAVLLWIVDLRLEAIMVVVVCATSAMLNWLLKLIVARPRPSAGMVEILQKAAGLSFPSGHVMSYVSFWGLLFSLSLILFKGNHWWRTALLIISALFVILVGPSRIYLGDHWASDVLGAYLFSGILLGIALWIYLHLKEKGVLAPRGERAKSFQEKYVRPWKVKDT